MCVVTLAVCTWNRSRVLCGTLQQISQMEIPAGLRWEVVVVDNNSTDDTPAVVEGYADRLPLRYVSESRQGIAFARNAAVAAANGDLLIFLDSDCRPARGLLAEYLTAADEQPAACVFGGTIEPEFEIPPSRWLADNLDLLGPAYGRLFRPGPNRLLGPTEPIQSGNMAARTEILRRYPFDTSLGRVGAGRVGGEEIDFHRRVVRDGHPVYWVGTAAVRHFIPAAAVTPDYIRRSFFGEGRSEYRMNPPTAAQATLFGVPRWAIRQHLGATIARWIFGGIDSRRWLEAYTRSAWFAGWLSEARASARGQRAGGSAT